MSRNREAALKMEAHHREMVAALRERVGQMERELRQGGDVQEAARPVAVYVERTVFPHARAEEETLYKAARERRELAPLVESMVKEHQVLGTFYDALVKAEDPWEAYSLARLLEAFFAFHADKENQDLLPHLVADETLSLEDILRRMGELFSEEAKEEGLVLDVRELPRARRHATIFALLERLGPGESLVIVNDHDPQPLYYQLQALYPQAYSWTYREKGPEVWKVAIRREP